MSEKYHNLVSVIIPSKNRPEFLSNAIESVRNQTYRPIELIIIDDGSDQPINSKVKELNDREFSIQIIRNHPSKGVAAARNQGIKQSKGKWVAFLDDDDEWIKNKLERQVDELSNSTNKTIRGASCHLIQQDENKKPISKVAHHFRREQIIGDLLYADNNLEPATLMIERIVFEEIGYYKENFPTAEDREWLLRYLVNNNIHVVDEYLVVITQHTGERLTLNHQKMMMGEALFLDSVKSYVRRLNGNHNKAIGYRYAKYAHETILAGFYVKSIGLYFKSICCYPLGFRATAGFFVALLGPKYYRRILSLRMKRLQN